jgi:alkanesulfonate monooxygenase SsuD/methylene tetrahydromethanopterin reductase-like flavin-dependent oxidoreductase (luciferase family)
MIGSKGPRMLRATLPYVDAWNVWFVDTGNRPAGVRALRERVDEACREVGRNPAEVERTVAVMVRLPGGSGRVEGSKPRDPAPALVGSPSAMADVLRGFAAEGIGHVQLVVDPITIDSIHALGAVLKELDRT